MDDDCAAFKTETLVSLAKLSAEWENTSRNHEAVMKALVERVAEIERENKSVARQVIVLLGTGLAAACGVIYHNLVGK